LNCMVLNFCIAEAGSHALQVRLLWPEVVWINMRDNAKDLLVGFGLGTLEATWEQLKTTDVAAQLTSDYLIRFVETGLLGLGSLVALLWFCLSQSWKLAKSSDTRIRILGVLLLTTFVQIAASSVSLPVFSWVQLTSIFWASLSILVALAPMSPHIAVVAIDGDYLDELIAYFRSVLGENRPLKSSELSELKRFMRIMFSKSDVHFSQNHKIAHLS